MPPLENHRHEMFATGIAKGMTAIAAYEMAGYKPDHGAASRLSSNVKIMNRVQEMAADRAKAVTIDKQWVLAGLVKNYNRAMQAEEVRDREGNPTGEFVYEGSVANRALELVGKELGMFVDRSLNVNVNVDVSDKPVKAAAPEVIEAQAVDWAKEHGGSDEP